MIKRDSSALLLGNTIYLVVHRGTESIPAPADKIFELLVTDEPNYIGSKVKEALYAFIQDKVRFGREDWKKVYEPQLLRMGFKTVKKMYDSVKIVNIFSRDNKLMLLPYKNCGYNKSGTKSFDDKIITTDLEGVSDYELGEMLKIAFEISTLEV